MADASRAGLGGPILIQVPNLQGGCFEMLEVISNRLIVILLDRHQAGRRSGRHLAAAKMGEEMSSQLIKVSDRSWV